MDHAGLPSSVTEHRHMPSRRVVPRRYGTSYHVRSTAKRLAQSKDPKPFFHVSDVQHNQDGGPDELAQLRPRLEMEVRKTLAAPRADQRPLDPRVPAVSIRDEEDEGRELAHSKMPLPSDRFPRPHAAALEHRAFARTPSKGKVRIRQAITTEDAQVAQLYHNGQLYDNHEKGLFEEFNLNSIRHEEPVYSIRFDKRTRKTKEPRGVVNQQPLHLDLSFTDLGDDNAIAQWFVSSVSTPESPGDETIQTAVRASAEASLPLKVVYELTDSSPDVSTPDLVTDTLSEFDCLDKSELLDDGISQREVVEGANPSSNDAWVILD